MSAEDKFESWWKHYPRKTGKRKAREAYKNALKRLKAEKKGGFMLLLERVTKFRQCVDLWPKYDRKGERVVPDKIPHPTTWLNQDRWDDDENEWLRYAETKADDIFEDAKRAGQRTRRESDEISDSYEQSVREAIEWLQQFTPGELDKWDTEYRRERKGLQGVALPPIAFRHYIERHIAQREEAK